jgi:uncharacterized protein
VNREGAHVLRGRALGVFTSRDAAQEFIKGDPFVVNGVVARYTLHDWNEVVFTTR